MGTGSFVFSLPHFISPKLTDANGITNHGASLCHNESILYDAAKENEMYQSLSSYRCFFIFGQILHGVGAAPILTLGIINAFANFN